MSNLFQDLNYTVGNEDSEIEFSLFKKNAAHVLMVAGSGARIAPLLSKFPENLDVVDTSEEQLFLSELRVETLRVLSTKEYLGFWGYPPEDVPSSERKALFEKIRLSPGAEKYFRVLFEKNRWECILYFGKWEKTFALLSRITRLFVGRAGTRLFDFSESDEYFSYYKEHFPHRRFRAAVWLFGNAATFNSLMYKGAFPKKNTPETMRQFYLSAFERLFQQGPARKNFFLQLLFFGKIQYPEGLPFECREEILETARQALATTNINYMKGNVLEVIKNSKSSFDLIVLSDVPSYFSDAQEKNFLKEIFLNLAPGGLLAARYYLHVPECEIPKDLHDVTGNYQDLISREKVQMYQIKVFQK